MSRRVYAAIGVRAYFRGLSEILLCAYLCPSPMPLRQHNPGTTRLGIREKDVNLEMFMVKINFTVYHLFNLTAPL